MMKLLPPKLFYCQNPIFATEKFYPLEVKSLFEKAVAESKSLNIKSSNETLLQLYSLYKQGTIGDVNIGPPESPFDSADKAKYDAWASLKGKSTADAQSEYIKLVNKLKS